MLASLGLILLCQLIGEAVVRGLGLPLPGPVLGLLLLLILLLARDRFALLATVLTFRLVSRLLRQQDAR